MKISYITDEATQDLEKAITLAKENGCQGIEIRSIENQPIDLISVDKLKEWKIRLDKENLEVANIAGSYLKCELNESSVESEKEKLKRLCVAADILDCNTIRGFAFFRSDDISMERVLKAFESSAEILKRYGKRLLIEADPSVTTTNHRAVADLLKQLDSQVFGAIYDPGNDLFDPLKELPFPDGYQAVKPYLVHIHIKDAVFDKSGEPVCVAPGLGKVGYQELLKQLKVDGYNSWLSLEPHYRKDIRLTEAQMRMPQGTAFSEGGEEAVVESILALRKMLEAMG